MMKKSVYYPWLIVFGCAMLAGTSVGICMNTIGVFFTPIANDWNVGRGAVSFAGTLVQIVNGFSGLLAARFMMKGRLKLSLILGVCLTSGSLMLMSMTDNLMVFYVLNAVRGFGCGLFGFTPVNMMLNVWFKKRTGLATSMAACFSGIAGAVFSPVFNSIISAAGWKAGFRWMALFCFVPVMLVSLFILRAHPSELGIPAYGADEVEKPVEAGQDQKKKKVSVFGTAMILLVLFSIVSVGATSFPQHFSGYAEWIGLSSAAGALMISFGMFGNIGSKLLFGVFSDKIGPYRTTIGFSLVYMAAALCLIFLRLDTAAVYYVIAVFYGFAYGVGAISLPMLTRDMFPGEAYGTAYSIGSLIMNLSGAAVLYLVGLSYDLTGGYTTALWGILILSAVSVIIVMVMQIKAAKRA